MKLSKSKLISQLITKLNSLTQGQLFWISKIITSFESSYSHKLLNKDFVNETIIQNIGDSLRIHHTFSAEPFTKDKFEYALDQAFKSDNQNSRLAPKGNPGHDIEVKSVRISLKTQADKNIKEEKIWVSKFMELGKGEWGDNPSDLKNLMVLYLSHLNNYEKIFTLRALEKGPSTWRYELVEIPKDLLLEASKGELEMRLESKQYPKPGYCYIRDVDKKLKYSLYFDGGGERKLQIKNLLKEYCVVHATWSFKVKS
ncbi:MAG: restriction endonuclease [Gammaproteobacteria bacterium]|nr:restriction endonuclease [Gammaproteobacteria bacterium]